MHNEFGPVMQLGYIVDDIEQVAMEWVKRAGVGPFYLLDGVKMDQYYYRGVRMDVELRLAFAYWGQVQVELIHPLDSADSFYNRALKEAPGKLNHCATVVKGDLDALLDRHNLADRVVHAADMSSGLKFVYLENYLPGGLHLELIQAQESTLHAFEGMRAVAEHWDGKNPIRPMADVAADIAGLNQRDL
ncbi:MAG: VOC family protein [Bacteroidales bacterium]|nr:VOC family protein [Bacteroidales bacterium]